MSQLKVNALVSYSGNTVTLGTSGDTINVASNVTFNTSSNVVLPAGAAGTPSLTTQGDTNTGIFFPAADTIAFTEGGTEAMRINSSGQVGIGTSSPSCRLDLGSGTGTQTAIKLTDQFQDIITSSYVVGTRYNYGSGTYYGNIYANATGFNLDTGTNAVNMVFGTNNAERMRITSAGALCVGGTNANGPSIISSTSASSGTACYANLNTAGAGSHFHYFINSSNSAIIGSITNNGNTGTAFNTSSDYRLKENVNYNFDATTRLKLLKPARFNFIENPNKTVDGFLAHEVQDIIPEAIVGTKDEIDSEGKPVYQGIDQAKLTPLLTKALQEAIAKIEQLEARLTALENN